MDMFTSYGHIIELKENRHVSPSHSQVYGHQKQIQSYDKLINLQWTSYHDKQKTISSKVHAQD